MTLVRYSSAPHLLPARSVVLLMSLAFIFVALAPLLLGGFLLTLATEAVILSMLALSVNILLGHVGLVSLGQAAYFGAGAYIYALATTQFKVDPAAAVALALIATSALAGLLSLICLKTDGVRFLLITLAFSQLLYATIVRLPGAGGDDGIVSLPRVSLKFLSFDVWEPGVFFVFSLAVLSTVAVGLWCFLRTPFGTVLAAIRENEVRATAVGYHVTVYKRGAFVIAGFVAGLAGVMQAQSLAFVSPEYLAWKLSAEAVLMVIIGGRQVFVGPILGAFAFLFVRETLSWLTSEYLLYFGLFFMLVVALFQNGLAGALSLFKRRAGVTLLQTVSINKSFGGLRVTNDVSLEIAPGERRAIIGPNGAGKTTLFNILTGWTTPDSGDVFFEGDRVTGLPPNLLAQRGVARSFQKNTLFDDLSVFENIRLAVQAKARSAGCYWKFYSSFKEDLERTLEMIETFQLTSKRSDKASSLSYGQKRQLEIALALAGQPQLLMMDEPAAGASPYERASLRSFIRDLPRSITLVIVEHDMELIFDLCDGITVLVRGQELMTGSPNEVRSDERVRQAYLGEAHA